MKNFVVYLTSYTGTLLPPKYIGSTSKDKILSGNYFGSVKSKKWKDIFYSELSLNKHLFDVEIISIHETRKDAIQEELRLQILNDVVKSAEYFNESLACPNGFFGRDMSGINNPTFGKNRFEQYIKKYGLVEAKIKWDARLKKVSDKLKGQKRTDEQKAHLTEAQLLVNARPGFVENRANKLKGQKRTDEQKLKISIAHLGQVPWIKGKKHSEQTLDKLKKANLGKNKFNITKEFLLDEYVIKNISAKKISEKLNCTQFTIFRYLKKYKITARTKHAKAGGLNG